MRLRAAALVLVVVLVAIGLWPTTTRQGVDYAVVERRVPLYQKGWAFVDRHRKTRALADSLIGESLDPSETVRRLFDWTHSAIAPVPPGAPVVDDHVWHTILRRYGAEDQAADVFATLLVYAGIPATVYLARHPESGARIALTSFRLQDEWHLADVRRGHLFRTSEGHLATIDDLSSADESMGDGVYRVLLETPDVLGSPYVSFFSRLHAVGDPPVLRGELQMPGPRLRFEVARLFGRAPPVGWASVPEE